MLRKMIFTASMALGVFYSFSSFADDIEIGIPGTGGTGCPHGSVSASLSPDRKTISLIFDQYVVQAGRDYGKRVDRKNCQIALPVHVPQGMSVSVFEMDYRGFNSLPQGAWSQFNVEYYMAFPGSPVSGPRYNRRFQGPLDDEYLITNELTANAIVWSPCGADLNLRTNTSMMVTTNTAMEQAMSTVDSIDAKASIIYQLQWRQCGRQ